MLEPGEERIIDENLKALGLSDARESIIAAIEEVKRHFDKPFGGFIWPHDLDLSQDPIFMFGQLYRLSVAPCGQKLRARGSLFRLRYYYRRHIERHQCLPDYEWNHYLS